MWNHSQKRFCFLYLYYWIHLSREHELPSLNLYVTTTAILKLSCRVQKCAGFICPFGKLEGEFIELSIQCSSFSNPVKSPLIDDIMSRIVLLTKTKLHAIQLMHVFRKLLRFQHCGTLHVRLEFNRQRKTNE
ncbi:unnamed protein product [Albugo candida]|uniref:Uncharacterized protein n=1 Tax=Albugo candida TaxID=65357 RepID=A0A024GAN1_9STRA|nr:unnamed protein product [Albugo candida]|eukprot:CCI43610.1 unnamed protein product [Albugo candida]